MQIRYAVGREQYQRMSTEELRRHFLVEDLFVAGRLQLYYWETDRTVLGGVIPGTEPLRLENDPILAADYFGERREIGAFNLGGPAEVVVDGKRFSLCDRDAIYIGRGARDIVFASPDQSNPARLFLISYPAHTTHPTGLVPRAAANRVDLGATATANQRTIFQYIHEGGQASCQLVTGMTQLAAGSVWNTMPPHLHLRRSEIYFYFDLPETGAVFHLMGPPDETRHLVVRNDQVVLSPIWSIHAGCGSEAYSFIWAMGGENQKFTDMDPAPISTLK
jgi:4-deoxy-L-threo-5-hexosulose-uronate ketol-isomerase